MIEGLSNGSRLSRDAMARDSEVVAKPKRRRFSMSDKARILHESDACAPGTVGAYLRSVGIYSSQLYAWRRERERGDLDPQILTKRRVQRAQEQQLAHRNHQLEVENRKLQRKIARLELFEEIRKKAAGLLNLEYKSPEFDEND